MKKVTITIVALMALSLSSCRGYEREQNRLDQDLRSIVKHGYMGNREATEQEIEAADKLRSKLRELVNENNLSL
jgi:hypothetical protein